MGEDKAHALLSPSSSKRWTTCTPSARFEAQFPSTTSIFAEEGTLAHSIGEVLNKGRLGRLPQESVNSFVDLCKLNSLYSPEMLTYCEQYADYCMARVHPDSFVDVETELRMEDWVPEGFGTGDHMVYTRSLKLLEFTDLKYGKGVPVSAVDNIQLKIYALGAYARYKWIYDEDVDIETIRVNIYQPRLGAPSEWEISLVDLLEWAETFLKPAAALAFKGEGEYVPGDHCTFCKARKVCSARAAYVMDLSKYELQTHNMLTDAELLDIFKKLPQLVAWAGDIGDHMLAEAVKGKRWDGMKLVEGRSNRIFADEGLTEKKLVEAGYANEIYTPKELLGVTKLKTAIGAKVFKELVEPDLRKPPGKPTLVNEDDPRQEFDNAVSVFKDAELRSSLASTEE